jgi:hypothetical protein
VTNYEYTATRKNVSGTSITLICPFQGEPNNGHTMVTAVMYSVK